jgi:hypothetical protein
MSGERRGIAFAIVLGLGALAPASAAWAQGGGYDYENYGGFVKPCSLDGVNPVHHPDIFGSPAAARSFGFVQSRDGVWHVDCSGVGGGVGGPPAADYYASTTQKAPSHHRKTPLKPSGRVVKGE